MMVGCGQMVRETVIVGPGGEGEEGTGGAPLVGLWKSCLGKYNSCYIGLDTETKVI